MSTIRQFLLCRRWLAILLALALASPAAAQSTQPVWWPAMSLYGRPVSQPFFEFPTWARFSYCRPAPLAWGYDPFVNYQPCDGAMGYNTINCPGGFVAHVPALPGRVSQGATRAEALANIREAAEIYIEGARGVRRRH